MVYVDEIGLRDDERPMQFTRGKWAKHPWCRMTADTAAELVVAIMELRITASFVLEEGVLFVTVLGGPACNRVLELEYVEQVPRARLNKAGAKLWAELQAVGA